MAIVNALDTDNAPCRFFAFEDNLINKILNSNFAGLQDVEITFNLKSTEKGWNVSLVDIN